MSYSKKAPEPELVTLITSNKLLVDAMLKEYPGILKGEQVIRNAALNPPGYRFLGLDEQVLQKFLASLDPASRSNHVVIDDQEIGPSI